MPILFNFHILLATFYTIFGTNLLIQCLVPVPVCCMFSVSQKPHIKRSPNGIKMDGKYFCNIYDFLEEKSTRDGARGGHEAGGTPQGGRRAPDPRGHPVRRLMLFFYRKKDNFQRKIWAKVSTQSELCISGYKRKSERVESGNAEIGRDRETYPILEGLSPLPCHGSQGPEEKVKEEEEEGGLSPSLQLAPEHRRGPSSSP
jgi:hypothetical protein